MGFLSEPLEDMLDPWTVLLDREVEGVSAVELVVIKERRKKVTN